MFHTKFDIAGFILLPPFLEMAKHDPFMAKTSHMVLQIGSSWILIIVPRDVPSQILHCWVYSVDPFPKMAKIWPFMAETWFSYGP